MSKFGINKMDGYEVVITLTLSRNIFWKRKEKRTKTLH